MIPDYTLDEKSLALQLTVGYLGWEPFTDCEVKHYSAQHHDEGARTSGHGM